MNFLFCLAIIYFNIGNYAWYPFHKRNYQNYHFKNKLALEKYNNLSNNSTNNTFMDEEELMKVLRFYEPI